MSDWLHVIEKLENKFSGWKASILSRGLVKSVLSTIHVFFMFSRLLTVGVHRRIEMIMRHFFWGKGISLGDKIILRGLIFHGFHGVKPEEKKLGQKFLVDIDAWLDLQKAGESDHLTDTVSYSDIYRIVRGIVEGPSRDLLESVAHQIAETTFEKYPQISAIRVKVGKPHVAVPGTIDYLGIEILRRNKKLSST